MDIWERQRNDPAFKRLVDQMTAIVLAGEYTPSDLRMAAMAAAITVESMRVRQAPFAVEMRRETDILRKLDDVADEFAKYCEETGK